MFKDFLIKSDPLGQHIPVWPNMRVPLPPGGVARLSTLGGQAGNTSSFFYYFLLFFRNYSSFSSSIWTSWWASCPHGKALATLLLGRWALEKSKPIHIEVYGRSDSIFIAYSKMMWMPGSCNLYK